MGCKDRHQNEVLAHVVQDRDRSDSCLPVGEGLAPHEAMHRDRADRLDQYNVSAKSVDRRCFATSGTGHVRVEEVGFQIGAARDSCGMEEACYCDGNLCCLTKKKDVVVSVDYSC